MAKLPARRKVTALLFRRANPDEILVVERASRGALLWGPPSVEASPGEVPGEAARRVAEAHAGCDVLQVVDLGLSSPYRVKEGPSAGEWTESFWGVELPADCDEVEGRWLVHYEAKAGAPSPRVREAITRLREREGLRP